MQATRTPRAHLILQNKPRCQPVPPQAPARQTTPKRPIPSRRRRTNPPPPTPIPFHHSQFSIQNSLPQPPPRRRGTNPPPAAFPFAFPPAQNPRSTRGRALRGLTVLLQNDFGSLAPDVPVPERPPGVTTRGFFNGVSYFAAANVTTSGVAVLMFGAMSGLVRPVMNPSPARTTFWKIGLVQTSSRWPMLV